MRRPAPGGGFSNVTTVNMSAAGGSWDVREVYASQLGSFYGGGWHPDQYWYAASFYPQTGGGGAGTFPPISSC